MAARAMASGTISFGLVAIPIKLYTTGDSSRSVSFSWLHEGCGTKVRMQYWCPQDEEVVERKDLTKGFQYAKNQYVIFTPEELKQIEAKVTHSIDIAEFVPEEQVDPVYFDKAYYLGPDKGGDRPYRLLSEAMRQAGRVALARYNARGKSYLVLLRPYEEGLVMQQLRFADEVRDFSEVPIGDAEVKEQELALAQQLIDQIASDSFEPEKYEDEARAQLWEMIEQKVQGKEITFAPTEEPRAQVIDLMAALKASLKTSDEGAKADRKPPKRAADSDAKGKKKATKASGSSRAKKAKTG